MMSTTTVTASSPAWPHNQSLSTSDTMGMTCEDRIVSLESKMRDMQTCLDKYKNRFKDQKLFCKYVAEYLLHKFGFNIWLRLEMVKAAGEGGADSDDDGLLPRDLPSIFKVAVNKSSKERQLANSSKKSPSPVASPSPPKNSNPIVTNTSASNGGSVSTAGKTASFPAKTYSIPGKTTKFTGETVNVPGKSMNIPDRTFGKSVPGMTASISPNSSGNGGSTPEKMTNLSGNSVRSSGSSANSSGNSANITGIVKNSGISVPLITSSPANGSISNGTVNRGGYSTLKSHLMQVPVGNQNKRRQPSDYSGSGRPAKLFVASISASNEKTNPVANTLNTGQFAQIKPVESMSHSETKVPVSVSNTGVVPTGNNSLRGIRVVGNVVELPEADISGLSKETEDADPLFDLDFGIPVVQDCSRYPTHPMTSPSSFVTNRDNNLVEIVHDDYNDPSIEIKYEESYEESSAEEEIPEVEVTLDETNYQIIAPPKVNQKAAARCRRSSPFDINWLYQMKKYQKNVMPYGTLIKRDEFRQWFEYLPNEKPEESRYRCRLCYKYMQTYGLPRSNWGPVESERGQLKRTECDNRNVINSHGKKKSHLEIMKRLQMEGNPEVGFVDRFDKTMKKQLIESLEKDF